MSRFRCTLAVAVVAGAFVAGVRTEQAPQTYRTGIDLVSLPVVVVNRDGHLVPHLAPGDFEVLENGRPQVVTSFAEGPPGEASPLYLGLMLDRSRSMERDMAEVSNAAVKL